MTPLKANNSISLQAILDTGNPNFPDLWLVTYRDGRQLVLEFNIDEYAANNKYQSRILWKTNIDGSQIRYYTGSSDKITFIENDAGDVLEIAYYDDGTNHIKSITAGQASDPRVYSYEYDSSGNLTHVYYPDDTPSDSTDNPYKQYHYEDSRFPNHLTGITNEEGERYATYAYDASGRAILTEHAGGAGKIEVLDYSGSVRVRNGAGRESVYLFDSVGSGEATIRKLVGIEGKPTSNCIGSDTSIAYDTNGYKDYEVNGRGYATDFTHDTQGREIARTEGMDYDSVNQVLTPNADSRTIETDWGIFDLLTLVEEVRQPGKTSNFDYENGRIKTLTETDTTTHTVPYSTFGRTRTWTYTYTYHDANQRIVATMEVDGPRTGVDDRVTQTFNTLGQLTRIERQAGANPLVTEVLAFDTTGKPSQLLDENGLIIDLTYTPRGWLETRTLQTPAGPLQTRYFYYNTGLSLTMTMMQPSG